MRKNQAGFGHVLLLVLLVAVAVVGFAGYRVRTALNKPDANIVSTTTSSTELTKIGKELDQANSQLDSGLNDTALDADINSL